MVKIRVHGTPEEVESTLEVLRNQFEILSESEPYVDRGKNRYVRVYLDVALEEITSGCKYIVND